MKLPALLACLIAAPVIVPAFADPAPATSAPPPGLAVTEVAKTGNGEWTYQSVPGWAQLPAGESWQPTHGSIVVDKAGNVYASTNSKSGILVFKPDGSFLRAIKGYPASGEGFHGMVMHEEGGVEYLYGACLGAHEVVKMKAETGEHVLTIKAPEAEYGKGTWNCTGVAVAPDGSIFVTDGYGNSRIHKFDKEGKHLVSFAGKGAEDGKCVTCHTCAIDMRSGKPLLLVVDRENRRLSYFDLEGNFVRHITTHLRRPCSVSFSPDGKHLAVAELESRVTILDENNVPVAFLGDNPNRGHWANYGVPPAQWKEAVFTAPHGVCFDKNNDLFVMDWNSTGRFSRLVRVK